MMTSDLDLLEWTIDEAKARVRREYERDLACKRCIAEEGLQALVDTLVMGAMYGPEKSESDTTDFWERRAMNQALYIGSERGIRIGIEAAERFSLEVQQYADNCICTVAPWLLDEPDDDEESLDCYRMSFGRVLH